MSTMSTYQRVRIIADSISRANVRFTTCLIILWRALLAEWNTHRLMASSTENISSNAASSRAVPVAKMAGRVVFSPLFWPANKGGMQGIGELDEELRETAKRYWNGARAVCVDNALMISKLGAHKANPNRLLEPFMETEIVCSFTDGDERSGIRNFLALRTERSEDGTPMADPHFAMVADELLYRLNESVPRRVDHGDWHLPFVRDEERNSEGIAQLKERSVARCARVSYFKHDGEPATFEEDHELFERLRTSGHWSPFEHQATPSLSPSQRSGNLTGWMQLRKMYAQECRTFPALVRRTWQEAVRASDANSY